MHLDGVFRKPGTIGYDLVLRAHADEIEDLDLAHRQEDLAIVGLAFEIDVLRKLLFLRNKATTREPSRRQAPNQRGGKCSPPFIKSSMAATRALNSELPDARVKLRLAARASPIG
jgi:hypothetical protein